MLVVEDNAVLAFMIEDAVSDAGHTVLGPVTSVDAALRLVQSQVPDLALVDIDLDGDRSGVDLVRELKERWQATCLFTTGQIDKARENADWAIGVLHKPFSPDDVRRALEFCDPAGDTVALRPAALELFAPRA